MQCGDCKSRSIVLDHALGEYYCSDCGLIIEDNVADFSDLSFTFTGDEKSIRHSIVSFMKVNRGLGSIISNAEQRRLGIGSRHMNKPGDNVERSFYEALPYLQMSWNALSLPQDLRATSAMLYRKCIRKQLITGRNMAAMALAVISKVCSDAEFKVNINKPAGEFGVSTGSVQSYFKVVSDNTRPDLSRQYVLDYVRKGIESLGLSEKTSEEAMKFGKKVISKKAELGKHPAVVAGAVIYKVCFGTEEEVSQAKVAESLKISERSIRRTFTELMFLR
jgi:transcription initiation factor TFIIB